MSDLKMGCPDEIDISKVSGKRGFEFRFLFRGSRQSHAVEVLLPFETTMILMRHLQDFQARYRIPIPSSMRPKGRPKLTVVKPDE